LKSEKLFIQLLHRIKLISISIAQFTNGWTKIIDPYGPRKTK